MPRENPDVSFIVPSYHSQRTIRLTLESIVSQKTPLKTEVIIIDSSADSSGPELRSRYPNCKVIESRERLWAAAARNRGFQSAAGDYLAFVDADSILESDWLQTMYQTMQLHPEIRLVGGWVRRSGSDSFGGRVLHWIEFSEFLPGSPTGFRTSLSSSNCLTRRELFRHGKIFNESFAMSEDLVLSRQLQPGVYFQGASGIRHCGRQNVTEVCRHLRALGFWSGVYRRRFAVRGSSLRTWRVLALALPAYRAPKIVSRAFRASVREGFYCLAHLPFLLACLLIWAGGFYRGLRGTNEDS